VEGKKERNFVSKMERATPGSCPPRTQVCINIDEHGCYHLHMLPFFLNKYHRYELKLEAKVYTKETSLFCSGHR
jgi:hypothetical protein